MTIYSLYIYDRHCNCVYYQDWHRTNRPKVAGVGMILPGVARSVTPNPPGGASQSDMNSNRNTLSSNSGVVVAVGDGVPLVPPKTPSTPAIPVPPSTGLPFDEEAKLVYGVILSLRNMVKKLSGRDENFVNYRTSSYKLHLYETITGYKFVMLSDPTAESLRYLLRQIYTGPFLAYVVRNPLTEMDARDKGIDNEHFRVATDRLIRSVSVFS